MQQQSDWPKLVKQSRELVVRYFPTKTGKCKGTPSPDSNLSRRCISFPVGHTAKVAVSARRPHFGAVERGSGGGAKLMFSPCLDARQTS